MKTFKILFAVIFAITFVSSSFAQTTSDEINATATVLQSATVNGVSDLEFGNVTIGEAKEVLATAEAAGHFTLMTNTASSITFTLPANLQTTIDGLVRLLPVNFDGTYGRVVGLDNAEETVTETFNPTTQYNLTSGDFNFANVFDIYLGGEVTPAANQAAGVYTAEVTMTVTYN